MIVPSAEEHAAWDAIQGFTPTVLEAIANQRDAYLRRGAGGRGSTRALGLRDGEAFSEMCRAVAEIVRRTVLTSREDDDVFSADEQIASVLKDNGDDDGAAALREASRARNARWSLGWADNYVDVGIRHGEMHVPLADALLAAAVSGTEAGPLCRVPALTHGVLEAHLARTHRHVTVAADEVLGRHGVVVARAVPARGADFDVARALRAVRSLPAHRVFRWLLAEVHRQYLQDRNGRYNVVRVEGGFSGLADILGLGGNKAHDAIHAALDALWHLQVVLPGGQFSGLLVHSLVRGRPSILTITATDALLPGFVHELKKGARSKTVARQLVPVPQQLPPLVGHPYHHAAQAVLQLLVLAEARRRAPELLAGGVLLTGDRWRELLAEVDLPTGMLDQIIAGWLSGIGAVPPFLRSTGADRYILGAAYSDESALLVDAAEGSAHAARRARRGRRR